MKRLAQIQLETSENLEINLSPLIDMVFLLLIFFMVTTVFVEETGVAIDKPGATTAQTLEKNSILLALTADGRIVHAGQEIGVAGIRGTVARLIRQEPLPVVIVADQLAPAGLVIEVIDECKLAGALDVSLAAERR